MKKSNFIIIIVLVALCAIGWLSMTTAKISESSESKNYVEEADNFFEKKLYQRAIASYELALNEKSSEEIYTKINKAYELRYAEAPKDTFEGYVDFLERAVGEYPKNAAFIDALVNLYYIDSDYENMYKCLINAIENGYNDDNVQARLREAKYSYKIKGTEYSAIKCSVGDYFSSQRTLGWNLSHYEDGYLWSTEYDYVTIPNADGVAVAVGKDSRIIDATGMVLGIFEKQIADAGVYSEGLLPVCIDGVYGYYNDLAEFQFGSYEFAGMFQNGLAAVKQDGKWCLVNNKGEVKSDTYEEIVLDYAGRYLINETVLVKKSENAYAICNEELKEIAEITCTDTDIVTTDGLIAVCQDGLWGFVNIEGEIVIKPTYQNAKSFSNGVAAVCKDGVWGFINKDNIIVIEYQFTDANYMNENGSCIVRTDVIYEEKANEEKVNNEKVEDEIEKMECWQFLQLNLGITEE